MRSLLPAPGSFALGSFAGPLPPLVLPRGRLRRKKWIYFALSAEDLWVACAIVDLGYATNAFAFAVHRGACLSQRTILGLPGSAEITEEASFGKLRLGRDRVSGHIGDIDLDLALAGGATPISAIVELGDGLVSATEKRVLVEAKGSITVAGRRFPIEQGLAGIDRTDGLMPRRTIWRWGFALGRTTRGLPIGFNVTQGFVGEAECAWFYDGEVHPLGEPRFTIGDTWRIEGEGIDLTFEPTWTYAQRTNLLVVRSRFSQPVGRFRGRLGEFEVRDLPGVVEEQDVLW